MKSRALRFILLALFVGSVGGAAYVAWIEESKSARVIASAQAFDERVRSISRALLDIKGAQPGYVAAGQGEDYWSAKVDALVATAREGFAALTLLARTVSTTSEIEVASAAFEDFQQMDRRAREYARNGQRLLASDLVFSDGIEKMDSALSALDRARTSEWSARDSTLRQHRQSQLTALAGAAAMALVVMMALIPLPRTAIPLPAAVETRTEGRPLVPPRRPPAPAPTPAEAVAPRVIAPESLPKPVPGPAALDLTGIAAVCTELARVPDQTGLPTALERAAKLMDASGIVVWVVDPDERELIPVIGFGYPPNLFSRFGTIPRDAENATAAAFRTGVLQTVRSDAVSHGAIAAPLVAPGGPVGVMAAEVLHDGEQKESTRAAAVIVAAQLAALMGPPSSRPQGKTEAAGA
jgi:CHASE3 domain sensor protein